MIKHLLVKNFALIDDLSIDFEKGFNVLSGETGAGKTLLVNALKIVLGEKVSKKYIRHGHDFAEISAEFSVNNSLKGVLSEYGLESSSLIVRRKITPSGGKVYINDSLVSLQVLKEVSKKLVKITSQFENQFILEKVNQFKILDSYSKIGIEVQKYEENFTLYKKQEEKLETLDGLLEEKNKKLDYLIFQRDDIDSLGLDLERALEINSFLGRLENQSEMVQILDQGYQGLYSEEGLISQAERINQLIDELRSKDENIRINKIDTTEMEKVAEEFSQTQNLYEIDEDSISDVISKKEKLQSLEKKYGSVEDIFSFYEENQNQILLLENIDQEISGIQKEHKSLEKILLAQAESISKKRVKNAKKLSEGVEKELHDLNMGGTKFKINIKKVKKLNSLGLDEIEFLISPNIGEPFLEMESIVSGGELSRILLILSKYLHGEKDITYVFDEVDAGIGGETGLLVGKKLLDIGQNNQVLCITHLAQVAAKADVHFFISKEVRNKRTTTIVERLDLEGRVKEMARLVYGQTDKKSLEFAKSLLKD